MTAERIYQDGPGDSGPCGCWVEIDEIRGQQVAEKMDCDYHREDRKCTVCGQISSRSTIGHGSLHKGMHRPVFEGDAAS